MKISVPFLATLSACALLVVYAPSAHAQAKPVAPPPAAVGAKPHRPGMAEVLTKELGLSPAQQTQIKAVMKMRRDKRKAIDDALLTAKGRRDQQKALDDATKIQVGAILTPAQRSKYAQIEAAQKAARAANAARKP